MSLISIKFLSPRYWPTWLGMLFLFPVIKLPYRWQLNIGRCLGFFCYLFAKKRRHIAKVNLNLCYPKLTIEQRQQLLRDHFSAFGMGIIETGMAFFMSEKKLQSLSFVTGIENLVKAHKKGHGVLLLAAHFTTIELVIRITGKQSPIPIHGIYREQKNLLFNEWLLQLRRRSVDKPISRHDPHSVINSLKQGAGVFYLPDQDYGKRFRHCFVPFFGVPAASITSTVRLAKISQAAVVPLQYQRLENGKGYQLSFLPALESFPGDNVENDVRRINQVIESLIEQAPEQYFWVHRRFKTRPDGEERPY